MSLGAITRHNVREDFREHTCVYSVVAVLAIALIVFSTQMYHIDALKGIDSNIFLGAGAGILAIEVIALLKRNVSYHARYKYIIKEILVEGYFCRIISDDGAKKFLFYSQNETAPREYDELPNEFPHEIRPQVLMKALGKKNNPAMPSDSDTEMTSLKLYLRDNEYIKVKVRGQPGDFVLAGKQGIRWELIRKPAQYSSEQTLDVLKLRYEVKHGDTCYDKS